MSIPLLNSDELKRLYLKSKLTVQQQIAQFISETGRKLAVVLSLIAFLIFTGATVFAELWMIAYTLAMFLVFGLILYVFNWFNKDKVGVLEFVQDVMIKVQDNVIETYEEREQKKKQQSKQRIANLEENANFAVWEADLKTGLLTHTNSKFEKLFRWTKEQINEIISNIELEHRPDIFVDLFIPPDHKEYVLKAVKQRLLEGSTKPLTHRIKMKDKFDNRFKATLIINILPHTEEEDNHIIQAFVIDEDEADECLDTIRNQNLLLTRLLEYFAGVSSDRSLTQELIDEFKKIKEQEGIVNGSR